MISDEIRYTWHDGRAIIGLILVLAAVYLPAVLLQGDFRTDDYYHLAQLRHEGLAHPFDGRIHAFYIAFRVLPMATLLMDIWIHGGQPLGYYVLGFIAHAVSTVLFYLILRELFGRFFAYKAVLIPFLLALIAGVHADLFYNVLWIANRTEVLMLCTYLFAVHAMLRYYAGASRRWYILAQVSLLLSLFSKEQALHLPLLFLLLGVVYVRAGKSPLSIRQVLLSILIPALLAGGFLLLRMTYDPAAGHLLGVLSAKKLLSFFGISLIAFNPTIADQVFYYFVSHKAVAALAALLLAATLLFVLRKGGARVRNVALVLLLGYVIVMMPRIIYHILPRVNSVQVLYLLVILGVLLLQIKPRFAQAILGIWIVVNIASGYIEWRAWLFETSNNRYAQLLREEEATGPRKYLLVTSYHNYGAYATYYHRHGDFGEDKNFQRSRLIVVRRYGSQRGAEFTVKEKNNGWVLRITDPRSMFTRDTLVTPPDGMIVSLSEPAADFGYLQAEVTVTKPMPGITFLIEQDWVYKTISLDN